MPIPTPAYLLSVFLVFVRIGALLVAAPFFGHRAVPVRVKVFFAVLLAYALVGLVGGALPAHATEPLGLMLAVIVEAFTGVMLGFAARFIFWSVGYATQILGFQMGLSLAQAYNPADGSMANPLGRLFSMVFLIVFLLLDGHHHILRALVTSFEVVPLAGARLAAGGPLMLDWTGAFFATALRLAAPFMITLFLVDVALGVFARVTPQADLFALGLPLKLLLGLGLVYFFMQHFFPVIPALVEGMLGDLQDLIGVLAPGP